MQGTSGPEGPATSRGSRARRRNAAIFVPVAVFWLIADQASKAHFDSFEIGEVVGGPYLGVFDFTLAHNTGAAWGMLGGMTALLAVFSLAVCAVAVLYLFVLAPDSPPLAAVGLALVVAGGVGNAIDRFSNLYVIDFIRPVFIDFPVFNVADVGVTCGIVLFLASLAIEWAVRGRKGE